MPESLNLSWVYSIYISCIFSLFDRVSFMLFRIQFTVECPIHLKSEMTNSRKMSSTIQFKNRLFSIFFSFSLSMPWLITRALPAQSGTLATRQSSPIVTVHFLYLP